MVYFIQKSDNKKLYTKASQPDLGMEWKLVALTLGLFALEVRTMSQL